MYYTNCEWYVDMGEYNKPLCERNNLRPAKCSECPVYIRSIEEENAKLREQVTRLQSEWESERDYADQMEAKEKMAVAENAKLRELVADLHLTADEFSKKYERPFYVDKFLFRRDHVNDSMRELGIEVRHV